MPTSLGLPCSSSWTLATAIWTVPSDWFAPLRDGVHALTMLDYSAAFAQRGFDVSASPVIQAIRETCIRPGRHQPHCFIHLYWVESPCGAGIMAGEC